MDKDPRVFLFEIAYGREADAGECAKLADVINHGISANTLRGVIAAFDRQFYPTQISVRFGREGLTKAEHGNVSLWLDRDDHAVSADVILKGAYEEHLTAFIRRYIKPGMTVVDIGANVGIFTMMAADLVGETGRVIAFEPNTENCRMILLSIEENGFSDIVTLHPVALSEAPGAVYFAPMSGSNGGLLPKRSETIMDPNCIVVPAMRLDDLISGPVHYIKADVEGAEYLALRGGEELIREHRPIITIEMSMEMVKRVSGIGGVDFIRWIQGFGYTGMILGRTGEAEPIGDLSTFAERWGSYTRIEDIAFLPN